MQSIMPFIPQIPEIPVQTIDLNYIKNKNRFFEKLPPISQIAFGGMGKHKYSIPNGIGYSLVIWNSTNI
jgi:hypothetical protein